MDLALNKEQYSKEQCMILLGVRKKKKKRSCKMIFFYTIMEVDIYNPNKKTYISVSKSITKFGKRTYILS